MALLPHLLFLFLIIYLEWHPRSSFAYLLTFPSITNSTRVNLSVTSSWNNTWHLITIYWMNWWNTNDGNQSGLSHVSAQYSPAAAFCLLLTSLGQSFSCSLFSSPIWQFSYTQWAVVPSAPRPHFPRGRFWLDAGQSIPASAPTPHSFLWVPCKSASFWALTVLLMGPVMNEDFSAKFTRQYFFFLWIRVDYVPPPQDVGALTPACECELL